MNQRSSWVWLSLFLLVWRLAGAADYDIYVFNHLYTGKIVVKSGKMYVFLEPFAHGLGLKLEKKDQQIQIGKTPEVKVTGEIVVNGKSFPDAFLSKNGLWCVELKAFVYASGYKLIYNEKTQIIDVLPPVSLLTQEGVKTLEKRSSSNDSGQAFTNKKSQVGGRTVDRGNMLLYVPGNIDSSEKHPLVIALSPSGDPNSMIKAWKAVADNHQWFIAASKLFRNGPAPVSLFNSIVEDVKGIETEYPVDSSRIIAAGFSGGGMGSHMLAYFFPDFVSAVVTNTGMIDRGLREEGHPYPKGKRCVFLASPTDFRYKEMQDDRQYLEGLEWKTDWIEFSGGHTIAPSSTYEQAANWLESNL